MKIKRISGFDFTASQVVNAGTIALIPLIIVPRYYNLRLTEFANYVSDLSAWGNLQWDILINKGLDPYMNGIKDQLGAQNLLRVLGNPIDIMGGGKVECQISNTGGSNYAAGVSMKGFYFINVNG